jgi:hypothetical protein
MTTDPEELLKAAEQAAFILKQHKVDTVVIGATALAAYHYVRQAEDIDLGVNTDLATLQDLTDSFRKAGFSVELREPDGNDPLGGVIDIASLFLPVFNLADRSSDSCSLFLTRQPDHHRHPYSFFKHDTFCYQPVTSHHVTMVRSKDHNSIVSKSAFLQSIKNSPRMGVNLTAEAPVTGNKIFPLLFIVCWD